MKSHLENEHYPGLSVCGWRKPRGGFKPEGEASCSLCIVQQRKRHRENGINQESQLREIPHHSSPFWLELDRRWARRRLQAMRAGSYGMPHR